MLMKVLMKMLTAWLHGAALFEPLAHVGLEFLRVEGEGVHAGIGIGEELVLHVPYGGFNVGLGGVFRHVDNAAQALVDVLMSAADGYLEK